MTPNDDDMRLVLHSVPAAQGLHWIKQGWRVFRKLPLALSALLAIYLVGAMVVSLVPVIGPLLAMAAAPLVSLVYMLHVHLAVQDRPVGWHLWAQPFRLNPQRTRAQLQLGTLYALATVLLMVAAHFVDGGALMKLQDAIVKVGTDQKTPEATRDAMALVFAEAMQAPGFVAGLVVRVVGLLGLSVPFWYAPALIHWGGQGPFQALFSSSLGLWRNRGAFALNGLGWFGLIVAFSLVLSLLAGLLGAPGLIQLLTMPLTLLMGSVFYAGLYFMFVDTFRFAAELPKESANEPAAPPAAP